ncbi:hypothetical protein NDN08_006513 [Rhodosorus marinus]|uniref:Nucleolar protein 16 n=1 Tax=Rhodosorus marinus TaxID=101924 RepID=A0AAV8UHU8_9RHOD|nr:hypothetical protein NDN08_006513 [Rhodosorus marinus]
MAKGLRSKVKRAYRALKRDKMEGVYKKKLDDRVSSLHKKAGFEQAAVMEEDRPERIVRHGGVQLGTTFVPDHERPKLNVVHGPLAETAENSDAKVSFEPTEHVPQYTERALEDAKGGSGGRDKDVDMSAGDSKKKTAIRRRKNSVRARTRKSSRHPQNKTRRSAL